MNTFMISDTHFGHYNIIQHCNRPWNTIEDHDEVLISRWNAVVKRGDLVYHLGDFAMIPKDAKVDRMKLYRKLRMRLNGKIILIRGNHDQMSQDIYQNCFSDVYDLKEVSIDKTRITLCHFPMRSWNASFHGRPHIFGHVHGRLEKADTGVSCDAGVDVKDWNFTPVPWEIIREKLLDKYDIFMANRKGKVHDDDEV